MKLLRGGLLMALALLLLAPAAHAAQRYAAPSGAGTSCSQASPCSLKEAVEKAKANDEVIVTGGAYTVPGPVTLNPEAAGVFVHGDFSGPPPTIVGNSPAYTLAIFSPNSRASYLDVATTAGGSFAMVCGNGSVAERIRSTAKATSSGGFRMARACVYRDSLALAEGENAIAVFATGESTVAPGTVRNVTAIATGEGSAGLRAASDQILGPKQTFPVSVSNSILSGDSFDVSTFAGLGGTVDIHLAYSNFDDAEAQPGTTVTQGTGNQATPPMFLDAAGGDYREAPGSVTIDAGAADPFLGATDLDGNPRFLGPAPDIGAFEFVPPPPPPPPAGVLQSLSLKPRLFRTVNAGEAIFSATRKPKAPIGASVSYSLSAAGAVDFMVERVVKGRKVGKRCVRQTKANRTRKRCAIRKPVKGAFTHSGLAGVNGFRFSGRIGGKGLKPGRYELVGEGGGAVKRAPFRVVR